MRFQWLKIDKIWEVAQVKPEYFVLCGSGTEYPIFYAEEWGPICRPPMDKKPKTILVVDPSGLGVVNSADYGNKKVEGVVYNAPDFKITSQRTGDCAVVALANVLHLDYKPAKMMAFQHGWSSMSGMADGFIELMVEKLEFKTFFRKDLTKGHVFEWERKKAEGTFLVYCKDHVMPARGTEIVNVQGQSHREILSVIEIRKIFQR